MTDVEHRVLSTLRPARELKQFRWILSALAVAAVSLSATAVLAPSAGASNLTNDRGKAKILLNQINRTNARVDRLGQKYDEAQVELHKYNNEIANTKATIAAIKANVTKGNTQLRADVIFSYVTNGTTQGNNPLFTKNASKVGATNVYTQLAEGNINSTIASLQTDRIKIIQDRGELKAEDRHARSLTQDAARSFNKSKVLQASLKNTLSHVKGQIATDVDAAEAAANAQSAATLSNAPADSNYPAPPPDSVANIAIRTAESYLNVPYV